MKKKRDFFGEKFSLPELEERVLAYWGQHDIFGKTLQRPKASLTKTPGRGRKFVFYEGPPGANGRPGLHHVLARIYKDIICRFRTMQGYEVPRKSGWDTHGLPVELEAEKQLGLKSKREIEEYGIGAFNAKCREIVWAYKSDWERLTERIGFWVDLKDPYVTYENDYMESGWSIIKKIHEKGLLYEGHKVVPWCTRCGTALSSHELALGYKEVEDKSVFVKFKLKPGQKIGNFVTDDRTYILSWTTTPWTLPGNVALAVGKDIEYAIREITTSTSGMRSGSVVLDRGRYIFAQDLQEKLEGEIFHGHFFKGSNSVPGAALLGLSYTPLFDVAPLQSEQSHRVYAADFVTTTDGTGVVHTAVMYGEDDYNLGKEVGLPQQHTVTEQGTFTDEVKGLEGLYVKAKGTEDKIFEYLKSRGFYLATSDYKHEYPHCWRCSTPLLYYARTSWFVAMSKLRAKLTAANKKINWIPGHVRDGRFGEWLKDAKDWNFSRERYWGTPIPVWRCEGCARVEVVGSVEEMSRTMGGARNRYFTMRHGHSENLSRNILDSGAAKTRLTKKGRAQVKRAAAALKKQGIDLIVVSPLTRTQETAEIIAQVLSGVEVVTEPRLREIHTGAIDQQATRVYHDMFPQLSLKFERAPEGGETLRQVRERTWNALSDLERKFAGKRILLISHEYPIWMLTQAASGWNETRAIAEKEARGDDFIAPAEIQEVALLPGPRNETGAYDLHRPWIDEVVFPCPSCRKTMRREKSVIDVWYDSGAMPFAQWHYPMEHKDFIDKKTMFPADYICEAVDQTRGWFYTLLAVSVLLGYESPYKNVICLGHINDKFGRKMSKSKGNTVDPWDVAGRFGIDAIRWYFYTANPPGEPKNFDEQEVAKAMRRVHMIIYNCAIFWKTYARSAPPGRRPASPHALDRWILARLQEMIAEATVRLERYEIREAGIAIEQFVDDLSRWYIRRSRRRFQKPDSQSDLLDASSTLQTVLAALSKITAPFSPFFAEALYAFVAPDGAESVHLDQWPIAAKVSTRDRAFVGLMREARQICADGLAARASAGIKVRQPLSRATLKSTALRGKEEFLSIIREEINVKAIAFDSESEALVMLDTAITPELAAEGLVRDVSRMVQELRAKAGFEPRDSIELFAIVPDEYRLAMENALAFLKKETGARSIAFKKIAKFAAEEATEVDGREFWLAVRRS